MFSRSFISLGIAVLLALAFIPPVLAGGWAVITLDELPTDVVAGEPLTIGFTVRQHGVTPMNGLDPTVTTVLSNEEQFIVVAKSDDQPGHYTATLTFPKEGNWEWSIQAFSMDQPMPALKVAAIQPASPTKPKPARIDPLLVSRALVFGIAVIALVRAFQRRSRFAGALAGLCLILGIGSFMLRATTPEVEAQGKESSKSALSQAELGRQLFLAKGCITCHMNSRAADKNEYWTIEIGAPDLSNYSAHHDVLFIRLKDPSAAKSDAKMPNLELKETEIEALIAFINSK
jgi:hypothetical protein